MYFDAQFNDFRKAVGMKDAEQPALEGMPETPSKPATHSISLSVQVNNREDWREVFSHFSEIMEDMDKPYASVHMTSVDLGGDSDDNECCGVTYDEYTLLKVNNALYEVLSDAYGSVERKVVDDIINSMMNAGILFRERS